MAVDRYNRDLLAEALAAFMRRDVTADEFWDRAAPLEDILFDGDSAGAAADSLLPFCGRALMNDTWDFNLRFTSEAWDRLCRCLVFLDSDREYTPPALNGDGPSGPGPIRDPRKYRLHAFGFLTSFVLLFVEGLWPLLSWWILSYFLLFVVGNLEESRRWKQWAARNPPPPDFGPFRDEADWRANEYRLRRFRIPAFDPEASGRPDRSMSWLGVLTLGGFAVLFLAGTFAIIVGMTFLFWPLTVLSGCFDKEDIDPSQARPADTA